MAVSLPLLMAFIITAMFLTFGMFVFDVTTTQVDCSNADDFRKDGRIINPLYDIDTPQKICNDVTDSDNFWIIIAVLPVTMMIVFWVLFAGKDSILNGIRGRKD